MSRVFGRQFFLMTFFREINLPSESPPLVNSDLEQRTAALAIFFQVADFASKVTSGLFSAAVSTSPISLSTQTWATLG